MNKNYKSVQLSSKWSKNAYYAAVFGLISLGLMSLFCIYSLIVDFKLITILFTIAVILLILLCNFLLQNLAKGYIKHNIIYVKKFNKAEKQYELNQLVKVKVYHSSKEKYILAFFKDGTELEKYIFVNTNLSYAGEVMNTESVLKNICTHNMNN